MSDNPKFEVLGDTLQILKFYLQPGQKVVAESGAMLAMGQGVSFKAVFGNTEGGMMGKLLSAGKRMLTNESMFISQFVNEGDRESIVMFSAPYAGEIVSLDLSQLGGCVVAQKGAFLASTSDADVSVAFTKKLGAGFLGGEGFILQKIKSGGLAFIHAGGMIVELELAEGESLSVDTGCLAAMQESVSYDIQMVKGLVTQVAGGEGLFLAHLKGPGKVWIQSLPVSSVIDYISANLPTNPQ